MGPVAYTPKPVRACELTRRRFRVSTSGESKVGE